MAIVEYDRQQYPKKKATALFSDRAIAMLVLLSLYLTLHAVVGFRASPPYRCRSTEWEIRWRKQPSAQEQQRQLEVREDKYWCHNQSLEDAKHDAWMFLRDHVMAFDEPMLETLGFGTSSTAPDGLSQGMIGPTIDYALKAKQSYAWADALPKEIFYEYVLNYANANEARSNWRPVLWNVLSPLISTESDITINDVVRLVNQHLWSSLNSPSTIYFKSGQTPLIFDPFSVMVFGYASCTGLAILFINALRTVGIAARLVGTPAWNGDHERGNHNWVEVYDFNFTDSSRGEWKFLEPSANQTNVADLATPPCSNWFCNPHRFPPSDSRNVTSVYAAGLVFKEPKVHYPLAWERENYDVPGVDRTKFYQEICLQC